MYEITLPTPTTAWISLGGSNREVFRLKGTYAVIDGPFPDSSYTVSVSVDAAAYDPKAFSVQIGVGAEDLPHARALAELAARALEGTKP